MDPIYLESERLRLRQYRDDDFELMLELDSDPEVMRYLPGPPGSRENLKTGVERTLFYQKKYDGRLGVFTTELIQTGEFVGWFLLRPDRFDLENTKVLELGYRLKKK